jgi:acetyl esterase/lipase
MRPSLLTFSFLLSSLAPANAADPPLVHLWPNGAPGFESRKDETEIRDRHSKDTGEFRTTNVHNPYVTVFLPPKDKATGAAVVVVPGGGHREMWVHHEGENVAKWLAERGVAAVVLRYRLAREQGSPYKIDVHAREDGQRALRLVRSKAAEWNVKPDRVGMMGFSAGGELTSLVCRKAEAGVADAKDPIDRESAVPSFHCLIYSGPQGIRNQTITKANAVPTFLAVGDEDGAVGWHITHYQDLKKAGVPAELHVYAKTPHAFGFRPYKATGKPVESWPLRFHEFLGSIGMSKTGV